ncbi:MAG: alpha/beta fold hydrolase [Promethearchaeota archaeon]|nr:MAG: alpha/beta fold hydrolase [Candidatus Lokiarchaeota archaeon]
MRLKNLVLILGVVLLGVGMTGSIFFTYFAGSYTIQYRDLNSADGTRLASLLYTPTDLSSGDLPGVVVCHGFTSNKQAMQGIALELVKCGFVVIALDFRGHGESDGNLDADRMLLVDDVHAAVEYLKNLPYVNNKSIGLVGHSMGGQAVMNMAIQYPTEINATVTIGMVGVNDTRYALNATAISNLLIAMGGLEELFTVEQALAFLQNATGGLIDPVAKNTLYGDFIYGNATKLVIAPWADHILEISNDEILQETCSWFRSSFYTGNTPVITDGIRRTFLILAVMGSGVAFFAFVSYLRPVVHRKIPYKPRKVEDPSQNKKIALYMGGYLLATSIAFLLLLPLSVLFTQNLNLIMANYLLALFIGYAIGLFCVFYLIHRFVDRDPRPFLRRIKEQVSKGFFEGSIFGILCFLYSFATLSLILHWSMFDLIPTMREIGATLILAIAIFPYAFLDQIYTRNLQDHVLHGRIKEWFKVVILASLMKIGLFIPLLFVNLGLASLVIIILLIGLPFLEVLTTWIYMKSGRNLISPTIYITLILAWVLVALMPFGNYAFSFI